MYSYYLQPKCNGAEVQHAQTAVRSMLAFCLWSSPHILRRIIGSPRTWSYVLIGAALATYIGTFEEQALKVAPHRGFHDLLAKLSLTRTKAARPRKLC